jgi:menaquinone-dependent protoporphyrinogen oxidase
MKRFLVLYATREGQTRRIADHVADTLRSRGFSTDVVDAAHLPANLVVLNYCGAIVAASVHQQKHEREIFWFIKRHASELERIPTGFLSVSLSQAGAEDGTASPERRAQAAKDAQRMMDAFLADTKWHPLKSQAVAGALMYSKYNFIVRCIMKHIARRAGGDTDTTRDYEYTDWNSLDKFVDEMTLSVADARLPATM